MAEVQVSPVEDQNTRPEDETVEFYTVNEAEEKPLELYTDSEAVQPGTEELAKKCHISKASGPSEEICTNVNTEDCISQEGYNYVIVDVSLQQDFQCSICHLIPSTPAKVSCCGNIFCYACITNHQSIQSECPLCRESTFEVMIDKLQKRKIQALHVHCVNVEKGCEWTGELREMQQHLQSERCRYQLTTCKKCDKELMYKELSHHMDNVCVQRVVDCDYDNAGCNFKTTQASMSKHIHEEVATHLQLSLKQLRKDNQHKYLITFVAFAITGMAILVLFGSLVVINSRELAKMRTENREAIDHLRISLKEHEREIEISLKEHKREIEILQVSILQQKDDSSFAVNDLRSGFTDDSRELTARTTENHEAIRNLQISLNKLDQGKEIAILQIEIANLRSTVDELRSGFTKYVDDAIKSVWDFFTPRILHYRK